MATKRGWTCYETVGIGICNPAAVNKLSVQTDTTLYYTHINKCNYFNEYTSRFHNYNIEMRVNVDLSAGEFPETWESRLIVDRSTKNQSNFNYYKSVLEKNDSSHFSVDDVLRSIEHNLIFRNIDSETDHRHFDIKDVSNLFLLGLYSDTEIISICDDLLDRFFNLKYDNILLAHSNPLVRDVATKITKIKEKQNGGNTD